MKTSLLSSQKDDMVSNMEKTKAFSVVVCARVHGTYPAGTQDGGGRQEPCTSLFTIWSSQLLGCAVANNTHYPPVAPFLPAPHYRLSVCFWGLQLRTQLRSPHLPRKCSTH